MFMNYYTSGIKSEKTLKKNNSVLQNTVSSPVYSLNALLSDDYRGNYPGQKYIPLIMSLTFSINVKNCMTLGGS